MGDYENAVEDFGLSVADQTAELCRELGIVFDYYLSECVRYGGLEATKKALKGLEGFDISISDKIVLIRNNGVGNILRGMPIPKSPFSDIKALNILSYLSFNKENFLKTLEFYKAGVPLGLCLEMLKQPEFPKDPAFSFLKCFGIHYRKAKLNTFCFCIYPHAYYYGGATGFLSSTHLKLAYIPNIVNEED